MERFGDAVGQVRGDTALIITFDGPVSITANYSIDTPELEGADVELVRRVQMFERGGKVITVIGVRGESCARLGSRGWGAKSKQDNTRVVLDIER
jgi:hypothetical protein